MKRIYLDNNATTALRPEALEEMLPFFREHFGNPSSLHEHGQKARAAVDKARMKVAGLIGARADEIIFTASGSEANNIAISGYLSYLNDKCRKHIISSPIEHKSVYALCQAIEEKKIARLTFLPVDYTGKINTEAALSSFSEDTVLVSLMLANNETGVIQPLAEIIREARKRGIVTHVDAVQALGKMRVNVSDIGADMLSISAHKINAPKGIGALYIRRGLKINPLIYGGSHERGLRAGTENVPAIVAFGKASEILASDFVAITEHEFFLRDRLLDGIKKRIENIRINGDISQSIPNTLNVSFTGVEAEALLTRLDMQGISLSTGSACSSGASEPSRVLRAMGLDASAAYSAVRFSVGYDNTADEIDETLNILEKTIYEMRKI